MGPVPGPHCDANTPRLIVNVETTPGTIPDDHMAAVVHESLKPRNLLPSEHLVDKGYTDSHILVDSQRNYGVTIVGPVADDPGWQAREGPASTSHRWWWTGSGRWSPARQANRA
jgi:hypothetical protein